MKYMKIVRVGTDNKLYSSSITREDWRVEYIPNQFVETKLDWGLLVTDMNFHEEAVTIVKIYREYSNFQVWECEIEDIMELPKYKCTPSEVDRVDLNYIENRQYYFSTWPKGTVMARRVKLTKRVEDCEWGNK